MAYTPYEHITTDEQLVVSTPHVYKVQTSEVWDQIMGC
jgi:hypothetical protein